MASERTGEISVETSDWGRTPAGTLVRRFALRAAGAEVVVSDLGASLTRWQVPARDGTLADIVLGFDTPAEYLHSSTHMGGLIGRWANRIADATFVVDGQTYRLAANDGVNSLHGGDPGFDRAIWRADKLADGVRFRHRSPDGENGFPGDLDVSVSYRFSAAGQLRIDYEAYADAPTPLNLTCHPYFNLAGSGTALDHLVQIDADSVLLTDAGGIPRERVSVEGRALDFRLPVRVRQRVASDDDAIRAVHGIDHCYVLHDASIRMGPLRRVAVATEPASGRTLTVSTTERGLQFYTAGNLEGVVGRDGVRHHGGDALCFEAQAWPNQINMPCADAVILRPGQVYRQTTVYAAGIERA